MHTGSNERSVSPVKMISLPGRNREVYEGRTVLGVGVAVEEMVRYPSVTVEAL